MLTRHIFRQVRIQHRTGLAELLIPRQVITRELEGLLQMRAHRGVHGEAEHVVQLVVTHGADNVGGTDNVPPGAAFFAVGEEFVFLSGVWLVSFC